jgi:NCS2 family nucleobase:cation symporter-2
MMALARNSPEAREDMKRPFNIVYWVNETPPLGVTVLSGLQHVGLVSIFLLVPVLACREAGLAPDKIVDVLARRPSVRGR